MPPAARGRQLAVYELDSLASKPMTEILNISKFNWKIGQFPGNVIHNIILFLATWLHRKLHFVWNGSLGQVASGSTITSLWQLYPEESRMRRRNSGRIALRFDRIMNWNAIDSSSSMGSWSHRRACRNYGHIQYFGKGDYTNEWLDVGRMTLNSSSTNTPK